MSEHQYCNIAPHDAKNVQAALTAIGQENMAKVAQLFKALADENRAKITYALCQCDELCVCDLAHIVGASIATTSHHLRTLHKQAILKVRKDGKMSYYALDDEHIRALVLTAISHKNEEADYV